MLFLSWIPGLVLGAEVDPPAPPPPQPLVRPFEPKKKMPIDAFDPLGDASKFFSRLGNELKTIRAIPPLTEEQRAAALFVRGMLAPDKLGGRDQTFNHADIDAVTEALLSDRAGLKREVVGKLRDERKPVQALLARRAIDGKRGPLMPLVRPAVEDGAEGEIRSLLLAALRKGSVQEKGTPSDLTPRCLTFDELRRFESAVAVLDARQQEIGRLFNVDITFPDGPSVAAMTFVIEGRVGVPVGAVVTPKKK